MKLSCFATIAFLLAANAKADLAETLFEITRSTNANFVRYVAHLTRQGAFSTSDPISAYWIMKAEDGHREELTWFEQEHAYGFTVHHDTTGNALDLSIKAMDKMPIRVSIVGGMARAEIEISGHKAILKNAYVKASGGLFPGVDSIILTGIEMDTGEQIQSVIHP